MILFAVTSTKFFLEDYKGGSNPLVLYLMIGFACFFVLAAIGLFLLSRYQVFEFAKLCRHAELTREEIGYLQDFFKRFYMQKRRIEVLTDIRHFNIFIARIAHHYENAPLSEEDLLHEVEVFYSIRSKLNFQHNFDEKPLKTARALPHDYSLTISFEDTETNNSFSFLSKVVYNSEFFLGIEPPSPEIADQLYNQSKPQIKVSFVRDGDAEYIFDSYLVKKVNYPHVMWYVRHAGRLVRGSLQKVMNIPATVMFTQDEESGNYVEFSATIQTIDNKNATFSLDEPTAEITPDMNILFNFEAAENSFAWGGVITNPISSPEGMIYRTEFRNISDQDNLAMLKFLRKVERAEKANQETS